MTQSPTQSEWSARLAQQIAGEVRRHRQARGMSAQQLADRCTEIGMPVQRSVLANLESGRRLNVTVAEVLVLATALQVPPALLVFPAGFEEFTEPLPGVNLQPLDAAEWFGGHQHLHGQGASTLDSPLSALRHHRSLVSGLRQSLVYRDHLRIEYAEKKERAEEESDRRIRVREELNELHPKILRYRESLRDVPLANRPEKPSDIAESEKRASELRREDSELVKSTYAVEYIQRELAAHEKSITYLAVRVARIRREIESSGWLLPEIPEEIRRIVDERGDKEDVGDIYAPMSLLEKT